VNPDEGYITSSEQDSASPLAITRDCAAEHGEVMISIVLNYEPLGREMRDGGLEHFGLYENLPA
jgi:hypothetical protein